MGAFNPDGIVLMMDTEKLDEESKDEFMEKFVIFYSNGQQKMRDK